MRARWGRRDKAGAKRVGETLWGEARVDRQRLEEGSAQFPNVTKVTVTLVTKLLQVGDA